MNSLTIASYQRPWTTYGAFVVASNVVVHAAYQSLEWLKESIRKSEYTYKKFTWTVLAASFCISALAVFLLNRRVNPIVSVFESDCDKTFVPNKFYTLYEHVKIAYEFGFTVDPRKFGDVDEAVAALNKYSKFNDQFEFIKKTSCIRGWFGFQLFEKNMIAKIVTAVVEHAKENNNHFVEYKIEYKLGTSNTKTDTEFSLLTFNSDFSNHIITHLQKLPTFVNMQVSLVKCSGAVQIAWCPKP